jgi:hypothetical protein
MVEPTAPPLRFDSEVATLVPLRAPRAGDAESTSSVGQARGRRWPLVALGAVLLCAIGSLALLLPGSDDAWRAGSLGARADLGPRAAPAAAFVSADSGPRPDAGQPDAGRHDLSRADARPAKSMLRIFVWPWAEISLDGRALGQTPLPPIAVGAGVHSVLVENAELGVRREIKVRVKPGQDKVLKLRLP